VSSLINVNLLPKNLRRKRESGIWKLLYVAIPLITLIVIATIQIAANNRERSLIQTRDGLEIDLVRLQPFVDEQQALQARQQALNELISVDQSVREGRVVWSSELFSLLETLPPQGNTLEPSIVFDSLNMTKDEQDFTNFTANLVAEISGRARDSASLLTYLRILEATDMYDFEFGGATQEPNQQETVTEIDPTAPFNFTLTVGTIVESANEEDSADATP
jgi:Tfp pilus assembly protein PilN